MGFLFIRGYLIDTSALIKEILSYDNNLSSKFDLMDFLMNNENPTIATSLFHPNNKYLIVSIKTNNNKDTNTINSNHNIKVYECKQYVDISNKDYSKKLGSDILNPLRFLTNIDGDGDIYIEEYNTQYKIFSWSRVSNSKWTEPENKKQVKTTPCKYKKKENKQTKNSYNNSYSEGKKKYNKKQY